MTQGEQSLLDRIEKEMSQIQSTSFRTQFSDNYFSLVQTDYNGSTLTVGLSVSYI
jgi:hypothetical protein